MNVKLIAIAALGKKRQIGLHGSLPWSIPDEYQHFQKTVRGHHVLIGRKNFEGHSGDVTGTSPIILTRKTDYHSQAGIVLNTLEEVFQFAQKKHLEKIFVIGGAEIYKLTLPYLSEFLWSEVDYDGPADTWFPEFLHFPWTEEWEEKHDRWTVRKLVKVPEQMNV